MISICKNDPAIWQTPEGLIPRLFTSGNHKDAIIKYTEAIDLDPTDVTFFSNRSAACGTVSRACSHNVNSK